MNPPDGRTFHARKKSDYAGCFLCLLFATFIVLSIAFLYVLGGGRESLIDIEDAVSRSIGSDSLLKSDKVYPSLYEGLTTDQILAANFDKILEKRPALKPDPPAGDLMEFSTLYDVVSKWNPDEPDEPDDFIETLQHFNFGDEYERSLALKYREQEIPFKVFNVTDFNRVSNLWGDDDYLKSAIKTNRRRTHVERSSNNHFMFWTRKGLRGSSKSKYTPPTEIVTDVDFEEWVNFAHRADAEKMSNSTSHLYFMTSADAHEHGRTFVSRDLPLFSTEEDNFFVHKVAANKGIQCRFGMRGIIAEAHYDSGKNMVAMLRGNKRYILNPPWACDKLGIIADSSHPSYRHSVIDWSDIQQAKSQGFDQAQAIDTIVRMGEVLYIPSFWFHYIVSMEYSIQCNSRSGFPSGKKGFEHIEDCFAKSEQ